MFLLMDGHRRIFLLNRSVVPKLGQSTHLNKNGTVFQGVREYNLKGLRLPAAKNVKNH